MSLDPSPASARTRPPRPPREGTIAWSAREIQRLRTELLVATTKRQELARALADAEAEITYLRRRGAGLVRRPQNERGERAR